MQNGFRLPNARAGEAYEGALTLLNPTAEKIIFLDIQLPKDLPFTINLPQGALSGTPPKDGDFDIHVRYFYDGEIPPRERSATTSLLVIQNPKSLWKNLPSDKDGLFWRPDEISMQLQHVHFTSLAASKRGRSHAHQGSFRDDDYRLSVTNDWIIAVVADGAGSAKYSRRGAEIICQIAHDYLAEKLHGEASEALIHATEILHSARNTSYDAESIAATNLRSILQETIGLAAITAFSALEQETLKNAHLGTCLKDFSSTALLSICRQFPFGILCATYSVGDGAIGLYCENQSIILLNQTDSGEFAGQTRFLDEEAILPNALKARIQFALVDKMTALLLMTDGISDAFFETETQLASTAAWDKLWEQFESNVHTENADKKLLAWLDFWSQGNHDDRTMIVVKPHG